MKQSAKISKTGAPKRVIAVAFTIGVIAGAGQGITSERTDLDNILPVRGFAIAAPSPERIDDFVDF